MNSARLTPGGIRTDRLRDHAVRIPKHRRSNAHLAHELIRERQQRRECGFGDLELDSRCGATDTAPPPGGNGWACTLKPGAAAPVSFYRLSAVVSRRLRFWL